VCLYVSVYLITYVYNIHISLRRSSADTATFLRVRVFILHFCSRYVCVYLCMYMSVCLHVYIFISLRRTSADAANFREFFGGFVS